MGDLLCLISPGSSRAAESRKADSRFFTVLLLLVVICAHQTQPSEATTTKFEISNTALDTSGGIRFQNDIGDDAALKILESAKAFIVTSFNLSQEKPIYLYTLFVDNSSGVAYTGGGAQANTAETHLSAIYVEGYPGDTADLVYEITGVLTHESTHVWQNSNGSYGIDPFFTGVIEGIADYIRLSAGFPATTWTRSPGGNWYDGYSTTAYFLQWIEQNHGSGFVNRLNAKMANEWTNDFFQDLTGLTVDQLWADYQAYLESH